MKKGPTQKIEDILADIYALDGSLAKHDAEVRVMIAELLEARPQATPDPDFITQLRVRVMSNAASIMVASLKKEQGTAPWLWWAIRIAPVGVFAVLTLALVQQPTNMMFAPSFDGGESSVENMQMDSVTPSTLEAPASTPRSEEISPAPSGKRTMPYGDNTSDQAENSADTMMMQSDGDAMYSLKQGPPIQNANAIDIFEQAPGKKVTASIVTLSVEGFVRVYAYDGEKPGELLGTSAVLSAGAMEDVPVTLSRPLADGEVGYAQLFTSDGDQVFEQNEDLPLYDAEGGFVYTLFVVGA